MTRYDMIRKELEFFKSKNQPVHLTLQDNQWLNGKILKINEDHLLLLEDVYGEIMILFERIKRVVPRK